MPINKQFVPVTEAHSSAQLSEWINAQDSLTERLKRSTGEAQLELLNQQWVTPDQWDRHLLQIDDPLIFERNIIMKSQGIVYWYARSIIPQKCYDLDPLFFNRLQKESIKNLIFDEVNVQRINFITYPANDQCPEFHWVKKYINVVHGILWVRLAEFLFQQKESFYLVEILLPALENTHL